MNKAGIYLHIPFCKTKCIYCDFYSVINKDERIPEFVECMINEIKLNKKTLQIWDILFSNEEYDIKPIGLAARDTLRIEMGYCLYGNDISEDTSPIEANLRWITKTNTDFIGSNNIEKQIKSGIKRKLIGFKLIEKSIPRNGYEIYNLEKKLIGSVTSGTFSPTLKIGIGLGYVDTDHLDNEIIYIKIRDKFTKANIVKTPFI